jgi:hypothetical protein
MRTIAYALLMTASALALSACAEDPRCSGRFYCARLFESPMACGELIGTRIELDSIAWAEDNIFWLTDPRGRCVGVLRLSGPYPDGYTTPAPWCNDDLLTDPGVCP